MCLILIIIPLFTLGSIYSTDAVTIGFALPSANRGKQASREFERLRRMKKKEGKLTQSSVTRLASKTGIRHCSIVQSTPDNSNLQGKQKKVRVIGSSSYRG